MLKTYLTVAVRSLLKRKVNSVINILGLALGIGAALVIVVFARNELTYDQYHKNSANTYIVYKERVTPNGVQPTYDTWAPLMDRLKAEYPEVDLATRVNYTGLTMEVGNQRFEETCYYVDRSYFDVFDFPLEMGNQNDPFPQKNAVVISKEVATRFFGDADPMGKEIRVNFEQVYTVSGVLKDFPSNSFVGSEVLLPIESDPEYSEFRDNWGGSFLLTFITMPPNADQEALASKFPALIKNIWDEDVASRTNFRLLPLHDAYDTFIGDTQDSIILLWVALGIILIAVTNFMNLSTARSMERAREIGLRKILGAGKGQVAFQFLCESVVLSFMALGLGVLIAEAVLPSINGMFDLELSIPYAEPLVIPGLLTFGFLLGILSGSYPSFFLSNFKILESLNSTFNQKFSGVRIRNVLVVFQFMLSILLIVGTLTIANQIQFIKNADMAFNKENLVVIPVAERDFEDRDEARIRLATFRDELSKFTAIQSITSSRHVPGRWSGSNLFVRPEGWEGDPMRMRFTYMDANFFDSYQVDLKEGAGFLPDSEGDQRESAIINEAAMRAFGWTDIQDKNLLIGSNKIKVVGLIEDFNYETLRSEIDPIIHFHRVPSNAAHRYITLRTTSDNLVETLAFAGEKWNILDPNRPFDYFMVAEDFREIYANEDRLLTMIEAFAFLSIFISCLGLFGLLSFHLDKRKKEIGIRKILGASVASLAFLITNEFTRLILLAFLIASPLAYYFMNSWLNDFAYHINVGWQVFLVAFVLTAGLALLTVSFKTFKAANANPVDSIQEE